MSTKKAKITNSILSYLINEIEDSMAESLDPEAGNAWEFVKNALKRTRKDLDIKVEEFVDIDVL